MGNIADGGGIGIGKRVDNSGVFDAGRKLLDALFTLLLLPRLCPAGAIAGFIADTYFCECDFALGVIAESVAARAGIRGDVSARTADVDCIVVRGDVNVCAGGVCEVNVCAADVCEANVCEANVCEAKGISVIECARARVGAGASSWELGKCIDARRPIVDFIADFGIIADELGAAFLPLVVVDLTIVDMEDLVAVDFSVGSAGFSVDAVVAVRLLLIGLDVGLAIAPCVAARITGFGGIAGAILAFGGILFCESDIVYNHINDIL